MKLYVAESMLWNEPPMYRLPSNPNFITRTSAPPSTPVPVVSLLHTPAGERFARLFTATPPIDVNWPPAKIVPSEATAIAATSPTPAIAELSDVNVPDETLYATSPGDVTPATLVKFPLI